MPREKLMPLTKVPTPVKHSGLKQWLQGYPDREKALFLEAGFKKGFNVAVQRVIQDRHLNHNLKSATDHTDITR
ncbi:hypothetical protein FKM82_006472 [Ascaphus truei]